MKPLPQNEWRVKSCGLDHVIVGMHTNGGGIYWTKFALEKNDTKEFLAFVDKTHGAEVSSIVSTCLWQWNARIESNNPEGRQ